VAGCAGLPSGPVEAALRGPGDECSRPLHIGSDPVPGCREGLSLGKGSVASTQWPVRVKGVRRRSPRIIGTSRPHVGDAALTPLSGHCYFDNVLAIRRQRRPPRHDRHGVFRAPNPATSRRKVRQPESGLLQL
jgi:hypothetical protein